MIVQKRQIVGAEFFSSFLFLVRCCKGEESWIEKGAEGRESFRGGGLNGGGSHVQKNAVVPTANREQQAEELAMPM